MAIEITEMQMERIIHLLQEELRRNVEHLDIKTDEDLYKLKTATLVEIVTD